MEKVENFNNNLFINILKGILISFVITAILFLLFSVLLSFTSLSENTITPVIVVITGISILAGSSITCIKIKKRGLIIGGLIGFLYFSLLYLVSSILSNNYSVNLNSLIMLSISCFSGIIGGIVGVNILN